MRSVLFVFYLWLGLASPGFVHAEFCIDKTQNLFRVAKMLDGYLRQDQERGVRYLNSDSEREVYRLTFENGKIYQGGQLFDTSSAEWGYAVFVMDENGNFYASNEGRVNVFHHSSFFAGGPCNPGLIKVRKGVLEKVANESGHYRPDREMFGEVIRALEAHGISSDGRISVFDGTNSVIPVQNLRLMHALKGEMRTGGLW